MDIINAGMVADWRGQSPSIRSSFSNSTKQGTYILAKYLQVIETYSFNSFRRPDHKRTLCVGNEIWTDLFFYSVAIASSFLSISVLSSWNSSLWFIGSAVHLDDGLILLPFPPSASAANAAT